MNLSNHPPQLTQPTVARDTERMALGSGNLFGALPDPATVASALRACRLVHEKQVSRGSLFSTAFGIFREPFSRRRRQMRVAGKLKRRDNQLRTRMEFIR